MMIFWRGLGAWGGVQEMKADFLNGLKNIFWTELISSCFFLKSKDLTTFAELNWSWEELFQTHYKVHQLHMIHHHPAISFDCHSRQEHGWMWRDSKSISMTLRRQRRGSTGPFHGSAASVARQSPTRSSLPLAPISKAWTMHQKHGASFPKGLFYTQLLRWQNLGWNNLQTLL